MITATPSDVPPDRDAVDARDEVAAADVDERVQREDDQEQEERPAQDVLVVAEVQPERG